MLWKCGHYDKLLLMGWTSASAYWLLPSWFCSTLLPISVYFTPLLHGFLLQAVPLPSYPVQLKPIAGDLSAAGMPIKWCACKRGLRMGAPWSNKHSWVWFASHLEAGKGRQKVEVNIPFCLVERPRGMKIIVIVLPAKNRLAFC